ncbi:MAG: transposase family protein [Betaproteobacteria bacterium]|nr:transposase family protein [Betaproteobacteria bacterium]
MKPWRSTSIFRCRQSGGVRSPDQIIGWRGKPPDIRGDNGPEYISRTFVARAERRGIRPGNPQQNAYIERHNRTARYGWLSHYLFEPVEEVQEYAADWM